jgi:hypothetical protein
VPRANHYFLPDYVWHITHRCHRPEFLLRFECGLPQGAAVGYWATFMACIKPGVGLDPAEGTLSLATRSVGRGAVAVARRALSNRSTSCR